MSDTKLLKFFSNEDGRLCASRLKWDYIATNEEVFYEMSPYLDLPPVEALYLLTHNLYEPPRCLVCGKRTEFRRFEEGYKKFCSKDCRLSSKGLDIINQKSQETSLKKYGCAHASQSQQVKDKARTTNQEKYNGPSPSSDRDVKDKQVRSFMKNNDKNEILEKRRTTNKMRYGEEFPQRLQETKNKMVSTKLDRYGTAYSGDKIKSTCLERYGTENYMSSLDFKEKRANAILERYGVEHPLKNEEVLCKQRQTMFDRYGYFSNLDVAVHNKESYEKMWVTKKRKGNTNTSGCEKAFDDYLRERGYTFHREYTSPSYPWHCDFYIEQYDLYIELNGYWTHGKHPYYDKSPSDQALVAKWSRNDKPQYVQAIKVWTQRDVMKRETAKANNLNYLEIFSDKFEIIRETFEQYIGEAQNTKINT